MARKGTPHRELADAVDFKPHYLEHRSRLQDRLLQGGAENLPDYEILEILLAASNPRGDTKPLAKALIDRFGGLAEVLSADPEMLQQVKGVDKGGARGGIAAVAGASQPERRHDRFVGQADRLLQSKYRARRRRGISPAVPRPKNALIKHERQQRGTIDHTPVYPREVVKRALALDASALILVHNRVNSRFALLYMSMCCHWIRK
jgi:DNA repair protein RadC